MSESDRSLLFPGVSPSERKWCGNLHFVREDLYRPNVGFGSLLFISANWDAWSPVRRFLLVMSGVAVFHLLGAAVTTSQPVLARVFHAVGTVTCGGGIFLAGQIFHLSEHWPGGFMLWSLAAVAAWVLLKDWIQAALAAILIPIWLVVEWAELTHNLTGAPLVAPAAVTLLALTYLTIPRADETRPFSLALSWLGGLAFFPVMISLGTKTTWMPEELPQDALAISGPLLLLGWSIAIAAPVMLAFLVKKKDVLGNVIAAVWVLIMAQTTFDAPLPSRIRSDTTSRDADEAVERWSGIMKFVWQGLAVALIQVLMVASLGGKLLYDRAHDPRVRVKTTPVDPNLPIRGRYLQLGVVVDASAFPDEAFEPIPAPPDVIGPRPQPLPRQTRPGSLVLERGSLAAQPVPEGQGANSYFRLWRDDSGSWAQPLTPLAFFLPEHVEDPSIRGEGEELWVEVTVTPSGDLRPLRLRVVNR